jgi:exodeoxyribonuclease X
MSDRAIVIDCETTGNDPLEVIELCVAEVFIDPRRDCLVLFSRRFKPSHAITFGAMATHHILADDLEDCPPSSDAGIPAAGFGYVIGHNVDYDWEAVGRPDMKRICTLALARFLWPSLDCHKLGAVAYRLFGRQATPMLANAHSAAADVRVTIEVLRQIVAVLGVDSWEALWLKSEAARVPSYFTFGKHKGMLIKDAPSDYKAWLMRQPDVDPYLMQALRA